ncbi:PhoH family protein [Tepidanaerobacter syntrophicus]|uniref:PhoH-like protein n=2 Tax=Tepidanaerobacteraceae TaxID=2770092 RepID=A0A0U9HFF9_9FIRM|nr:MULTISPECIES: PhoH family protein [Tepidanaerobacter]GAQ25541.1 phosphate starvation-inducible protein PhoH [Tepidanaerobacter syntrophicus]GLI18506.1 PhoH family protein [Tepidanaerobacter syntrophicus]
MRDNTAEARVAVDNINKMTSLFGNRDINAKYIEEQFDVRIVTRNDEISIIGEEKDVKTVEQLLNQMVEMLQKDDAPTANDVKYFVRLAKNGEGEKINELYDDVVCYTHRGKPIKPKTIGQKLYTLAMKKNDIVFGIGPAGTGKTYLAMAMAVTAFKEKEVNRIILTRPAVEAGEKLGFLPGDLQDKVDPYLRPLYDALYDILGVEAFRRYMEKGLIEVAPLAYMRGRTLDDSFVILDEAQNTTSEQMKMFLTRLGFGSKAVVTGDLTQVDLPKGVYSGLEEVREILKDIKGIQFVYLDDKDVVRHEVVQRIIKAYERFDEKRLKKNVE